MIRRYLSWTIFAFLTACAILAPQHAAFAAAPKVVVVNLHGYLWPTTASFVRTQLDEAWKSGASGVIIDLDTTDGSAAAAAEIKTAITGNTRNFPSGIAAFVHDRARGPGSIIPLVCRPIALSPGASWGGASSGSKADFRAAADAGGRNPNIAAAFISADGPLPELGLHQSDVLTLTTSQAQKVGYVDVVASDYPDILAKMGLTGASVQQVNMDTWTAIALWVSQPWATILLLALGLALIIIELMTWHSWGIAAIIGGSLVLLIFAAHITVGSATWVGVVIFLAGIALLLFETHVFPGHGLSAIAGITLIFIGMFLALGGMQSGALFSLTAAAITTVGMLVAFFAYLPHSKVWNKLGQPMRQTAKAGYVASEDYTNFLGQVGVAVTGLRPSGTAEIDGVRLPVVTEGDFIPAETRVQVVLVQGNRLVVRPEPSG